MFFSDINSIISLSSLTYFVSPNVFESNNQLTRITVSSSLLVCKRTTRTRILKHRYGRHQFKWDDFGKEPMFRAPILSIFPDEDLSQGGIATGKCTAYHGCKEREYQFVPRWKMRKGEDKKSAEKREDLNTMSMGQNFMSKDTPRDLDALLDKTMFRKYPMCVLENWVAADDSDFQLSTEPKQMAFEFEVADFTECHHTQWSSNNMVFRRGTASSEDTNVEDVTITSFSRSGVQGTWCSSE